MIAMTEVVVSVVGRYRWMYIVVVLVIGVV